MQAEHQTSFISYGAIVQELNHLGYSEDEVRDSIESLKADGLIREEVLAFDSGEEMRVFTIEPGPVIEAKRRMGSPLDSPDVPSGNARM